VYLQPSKTKPSKTSSSTSETCAKLAETYISNQLAYSNFCIFQFVSSVTDPVWTFTFGTFKLIRFCGLPLYQPHPCPTLAQLIWVIPIYCEKFLFICQSSFHISFCLCSTHTCASFLQILCFGGSFHTPSEKYLRYDSRSANRPRTCLLRVHRLDGSMLNFGYRIFWRPFESVVLYIMEWEGAWGWQRSKSQALWSRV